MKNVISQVGPQIGVGKSVGPTLAVICPGCAREGNFFGEGPDLQLQVPDPENKSMVTHLWVGNRFCPNKGCSTHVFVVYQQQGGPFDPFRVLHSFPAGRIEFNVAGVPEKVRNAFDEALTCTANECYVGAAMLIRKTLEAVCEDRSATGDDLNARIRDLQSKVVLPKELFEAMHDLRLLGNDAAHIKAKTYDDIGKDEVLVGVELAKEVIKATYQYKGLLGKLQALKKPGK
jgi:Domain of unknown function (DUF4145)